MKYRVNFFINDEPVELYVDANKTMLRVLREDLALTGSKEGCGAGECGACTVIVDGKAVNACLVLAPEMDGMHITTVEGLAKDGVLTPLQQSFVDLSALQCGFCTPGFLMSATALLDESPHPSREEIIGAISGNLCRCTGYARIVEAIEHAAADRGGAGA
ncbi:MAG TPA: (2Fe-2S)-binding protein [Pseudoflavonifractor sp.]|nr:(2Fe-2S)-binding protein [Pseudoflavonifractor sp.]